MPYPDIIKVEKKDRIAWLTLNRPKSGNAFNTALFNRLKEVVQDFDEDRDVRVVVIRGEGKNFTTGLDLKEAIQTLLTGPAVDGREQLRNKILDLQECITSVEICRKPVIAAAHGICYGAGIDLLSACDIRIACEDALFSVRETKMAIIADLGTLQRLPDIIGQGWYRELALSGRNFTAAEAAQMGFVTRICPDRESLYDEAQKLALEIAANSPLAVEGTKEVARYTRENGVRAGLEFVAQKNAVMLYSEDLKEAMRAFMEKRPPQYKGK